MYEAFPRKGEGNPYNGLYGDAPPKRVTFLDSRYGKGVLFSRWRYVKGVYIFKEGFVKGVPFQGKLCERVPIFEI